jgi:hypothetical protein
VTCPFGLGREGTRPTAPPSGARGRLAGLLLLLPLLAIPCPGAAQWVNGPGEGWVDFTVYLQDTRETYELDGVRRDIFADGRARTLSTFLTASLGLIRGLDAWVQIPFHRLRFDDAGGERLSSGLGDPRLHVRIDPTFLRAPELPLPVALRGGVKLDGGDFDVDAEIIPLGEGQRDWELLLEVGQSFHPRPLWASGWIGHRWREENVVAARNPGNEWFWWLSGGGTLREIQLQVALEGIRGDPWVIQGITVPTARRQILQVQPSLGVGLLGGHFSLGTRTTLSGRNLPAGTAVFGSFFRTVSFR